MIERKVEVFACDGGEWASKGGGMSGCSHECSVGGFDLLGEEEGGGEDDEGRLDICFAAGQVSRCWDEELLLFLASKMFYTEGED